MEIRRESFVPAARWIPMRLAAIVLTLATGCATFQDLQTAPKRERDTVYAVIGMMALGALIATAIVRDAKTEMPLHPRL